MEKRIIRWPMKARLLNSSHLLCLTGALLLLTNPCAHAQTNFGLNVQMIGGQPGLTITGAVGLVCEIQYASELAPTNTWLSLTNLTLPSNPYLWLDLTSVGVVQRFYRAVVVPTNMVLIPAGSFTMGNDMDPNEASWLELPLHSVYLSAFYMDRSHVTKALWDEVYNWATNHGYSFDYGDSGQGKAANHPTHTMTWYDCVKWCNARSEQENRQPAYYTDAALSVRYRNGQAAPHLNRNSGYRLPTEAEWEKAARGGANGQRFPWGNTISWSQANYNSLWSDGVPLSPYDVSPTNGYHPSFQVGDYPYTSPVDFFAPNRYGLYDMVGNLWQWCWDWFGEYSASSQTDPLGPASGSYRVLRGGSWLAGASSCAVANRNSGSPSYRNFFSGFRVVLALGQ